jgi:hypothetical protein
MSPLCSRLDRGLDIVKILSGAASILMLESVKINYH